MTQRERFLAIAVAVVVGLFGLQYLYQKVSKTLTDKQDAVEEATMQIGDIEKKITDGLMASRKLDQLNQMSLPSNNEMALRDYVTWLFKLGQESGVESKLVAPPDRASKETEAYKLYKFQVQAKGSTDKLVELLGRFYDKRYLHRIQNLKLTPTKEPDVFDVTMNTTVLALKSASPKQESSTESSGRLRKSIDEFKEQILARNPFSPPNTAPTLEGKTHEFVVGESGTFELKTKDAENHQASIAFKEEDKLPEGLKLRGKSIRWTPKEAGKFTVPIEIVDDGWPKATREEKLVFTVKKPKKEEPKKEPKKFDVATQAFITAIVGGRDGRMIMINSRTEGRSIQKREGEEFEVGEIKAKVLAINLKEDFAELESEGMRWIVDMDSSLAEAYQKGLTN